MSVFLSKHLRIEFLHKQGTANVNSDVNLLPFGLHRCRSRFLWDKSSDIHSHKWHLAAKRLHLSEKRKKNHCSCLKQESDKAPPALQYGLLFPRALGTPADSWKNTMFRDASSLTAVIMAGEKLSAFKPASVTFL